MSRHVRGSSISLFALGLVVEDRFSCLSFFRTFPDDSGNEGIHHFLSKKWEERSENVDAMPLLMSYHASALPLQQAYTARRR